MSDAQRPPARTPWSRNAIGITAAIAIAAFVGGFAWLPMQQGQQVRDLWSVICTAAGLVAPVPTGEPIVPSGYPTSQVALTPDLLRGAGADAIGRGATLALRCSMCHGADVPSSAETPSLAGQPAVSIYKQLLDFQSGARPSAVMRPLVADLDGVEMRDLAAYYAFLPRRSRRLGAEVAAPAIVAVGAPMRGIAPCGACHGTLESKAAAPWLGGQPAAYLRQQLVAFAAGARTNDISQQMRNVARAMTRDEIETASRFYALDR
jgi:cytochrome c553